MAHVKEFLENNRDTHLPIVIFNSHHHYDHVWGNCAFAGSPILAHVKCKQILEEEGVAHLSEFRAHRQGNVELVIPSLTFSDRRIFKNDGVEFFYTPGHTVDSASCIDRGDGVLFVADNVESPIPYLYNPDLKAYIGTLEHYIELEPEVIIPSHDPPFRGTALVTSNIDYLQRVLRMDVDIFAENTGIVRRHIVNLCEIGDGLVRDRPVEECIAYFEAAIEVLHVLPGEQERMEYQRVLQSVIDRVRKTDT